MFCLRVLKEWVTWLAFINLTNRSHGYAVWLNSGISQLKCLQYDRDREFPDLPKIVRLTVYLFIYFSNSHGPSMHNFSMEGTNDNTNQVTAMELPGELICKIIFPQNIFCKTTEWTILLKMRMRGGWGTRNNFGAQLHDSFGPAII